MRTTNKQRFLDSFKTMYPYTFQAHVTVTPPRYAVDGNIKSATDNAYTRTYKLNPDGSRVKVYQLNPDGSRNENQYEERYTDTFHPFFPDSNQKMNLWFIDSLLKPLNSLTEFGGSPLFALVVAVPKQPDKPQHIHCALGSFGDTITASGINEILSALGFSHTTALATEFHDNTENYIYKHLLQRNVVVTPHCWRVQPKKQTPIL